MHEILQSREVDVFFPTLRVKPKNPRAAKIRPYFPGYMFVNVDLGDVGYNAFEWTPGTRGLVTYGGEPAAVPEKLIAELKSKLEMIEAAGGYLPHGLKKGDRVRILSGPFEGYEAIFDLQLAGKERVQVLLKFLSSHAHPLKIDQHDIEKLK